MVEVNMEDKVEVMAGETAQITCMFTTDEGLGGTTIQWFYVSLVKLNVRRNTQMCDGCHVSLFD